LVKVDAAAPSAGKEGLRQGRHGGGADRTHGRSRRARGRTENFDFDGDKIDAADRSTGKDCGKMEGEEILNPGRPTADAVYSYPGGGGGSRTTPEAHDDGVMLLVLGPGASSASTDGPVTYHDVATELLITSARPPATPMSNVTYTDWSTAHVPSGASVAPSQSVVGAYAYPGVVMAMEHSGSSAPAPATRSSESYTDMLMAHLSSDMSPAAWNNVVYPASATATATPSAAINGVTTAYPGGLNLNAVGFGYAIDVYQGMADLGSEHLHPTGTGTAAAAAATEPGGGYYYNNSGMALPFAAQVSSLALLFSFSHVAVEIYACSAFRNRVAKSLSNPLSLSLNSSKRFTIEAFR
jgi:hypothetical protein